MEDITGQQEAVAKAQAAMEEAQTPFPDAPDAVDDLVTLPGGLIKGSELITTAVVRELNGEDEEKLARALKSGSQFHFFNTLLECGTVRIGNLNPEDTTALLKELLIGDRDQLLLGIRNVTYGPSVEVLGWVCPKCREASDITLDITRDIPQKTLADPRKDRVFEVPLRRGRAASCRLLSGRDQEAVNADEELTSAERNTIILTKCVQEITDPGGGQHLMAGWPSLAREMSIPDRRTILKELADRSPGPRYHEIKLTHSGCGKEVTLALAIGDLFLV